MEPNWEEYEKDFKGVDEDQSHWLGVGIVLFVLVITFCIACNK